MNEMTCMTTKKHIPLVSCLQWWRSATSGLQPLTKHQPEHQHQIRAQFATTGAHHPVRFPPSAAAAGVQPTGGAWTFPCRQPQLLLQLVWRLRPRGPPARLQLAPGTGQTPRGQRRQGEPLCQALAHGLVGDIESPSQACSHQPVRETEGLDVERNEGTRVLRANIIMLLFNPVVANAIWQFRNISKFDSLSDTGTFDKSKIAGQKYMHKHVVPGTWRGLEEDCWGETIKNIVQQ